MPNVHSARDSFLGYQYQSLQALNTLLSIKNDSAHVCIEAEDDFTLIQENGTLTLAQVKKTSKELGIKSSDLWRTLRIWSTYIKKHNIGNTSFIFLTTSQLQNQSSLRYLMHEHADVKNIADLQNELAEEAQRVCLERETQQRDHKKKYAGCKAYLALSPEEQKQLLSQITILAEQARIEEIPNEVAQKLATVPRNIRDKVVERLFEWWHGIVLKSLIDKEFYSIGQELVLEKITDFSYCLREDTLIDDMQNITPPLDLEIPPNIRKQLVLIDALHSKGKRSAKKFYIASTQRHRWIKDNPGNHQKIAMYDTHLCSEWEDTFTEKCSSSFSCDEEKKKTGYEILVWSDVEAHRQISPISNSLSNPDYVRGSYQVLAENLQVGWHPDYTILLKEADDDSK